MCISEAVTGGCCAVEQVSKVPTGFSVFEECAGFESKQLSGVVRIQPPAEDVQQTPCHRGLGALVFAACVCSVGGRGLTAVTPLTSCSCLPQTGVTCALQGN